MFSFDVPAMNCGSCTSAITKAIQSVDPTAKVSTDVPQRRVTVVTDADESTLIKVISEAGYEARPGGAEATGPSPASR